MTEYGNADFSDYQKHRQSLRLNMTTIFQMSQIETLPVTSKELRQEIGKDKELDPLLKVLSEKNLQESKAQYTIMDCCIVYGQKVYPMKVTTTKKTIECLRGSFERLGLLRVLVSDKGSQFTSVQFQRFMQRKGVKLKASAPFKPSSSGQAKCYVATLKQ
ncbi:transposon Tf2-6 polyprotein [Trichonephila inaurata madagascariensis]|uniref:Transposon Tf2-6 polyprotein n=1 Tax=Trichonephila inaurata madagascariensis TaxID=2747483 RepID=A0A8X7CL81_9ARAC|nr:transposon Tf2-6 polyprotein [Trichonephila inaurata madagascariensis]GFY72588.1 transposon Tf2-6 polyprotein [Trichonephila inaurata madagascariensis]